MFPQVVDERQDFARLNLGQFAENIAPLSSDGDRLADDVILPKETFQISQSITQDFAMDNLRIAILAQCN